MIELLTNDHFDKILDLFDGTKQEIKIISPFLAYSMAERLCSVLKGRQISCRFITRFYLEDMIAKASSLDALELLINHGIQVYLVKKLHTKLYLFDDDNAILGSANFTNGGFKSNIELSLLLSEERGVIKELHSYFDGMANQLANAKDGLLTAAMIADARKQYADLFRSKKGAGKTRSTLMYGAALDQWSSLTEMRDVWNELDQCEHEQDLVCTLFKEAEKAEQVHYPFTIWLKFAGEANDRMAGGEPFSMTDFTENGRTLYLSNYPFKVSSIQDGDEIYFAGLTTDAKGKNQPVIAGKGHLAGFSDQNYASADMLREYDWMERYPWYCVITDCEIIDAPLNKCIPLDSVLDALGSDTYLASFGRDEDISAVAKKHYQKAHIRLSGNAKQYIDKKLEELKTKYGVIRYQSDVG